MDVDCNTLSVTTDWETLREACNNAQVMEELCARYRPPVFAYFRSRGLSHAQAADLTQDFFANNVLRKNLFQRADPKRGRLRDLMLKELANLVIDKFRVDSRATGTMKVYQSEVALETESTYHDSGDDHTRAFNEEWVSACLNEAIQRCEEHFTSTGRSEHWHAFQLHVLWPATNSTKQPTLAQVAEATTFDTAAHAGAATSVVRKRLRVLFYEVIGETVASRDEWSQEIEFFDALLGKAEQRNAP